MTKFIIIRHGESEANERKLIAGHTDFKLTALGRTQAEQTAAHLVSEQINAIYASDLCRAMETAEANAKCRNLTVIPCPELRETFCGSWENRTFDDIRETEPTAYECFKTQLDFTFPGGENIWESGIRFYNKMLEIAKANPDRTVLIVAHGAVIRAFWALIHGISKEEAAARYDYPSNASYSTVQFDGERIIPMEYSHDSHLSVATHLHL